LTPAAWEVLRAHSWPGNLSELYRVLVSACLRTERETLDVADLPLYLRLERKPSLIEERPLPLKELLEGAERRLIALALRKAGGNKSRAAEMLAIWRPLLLRRMEALGLSAAEPNAKKKPKTEGE
jgi:DNA-binding NtrC family response regulator